MRKLTKKWIKYITATALAVSMTCSAAFAVNYGSVNASTLNLRSSASTSASILTGLTKGTPVAVLETSNGWSKIATAGKVGYVSADYIKNYKTTINFNIGDGVVINANKLNIRASAATTAKLVGSAPEGSTLKLIGISANGWYRVQYGSVVGYASSYYIQVITPRTTTETSRGSTTTSSSTSASSSTSTAAKSSVNGSSVVSTAKAQLGKPYSYGSTGPSSFDCSGLVYYCYKQQGKTLARSSAAQYTTTTRISKSQLQPGDLVFFSNETSGGRVGHVGIYVGGGQYINASTSTYKVSYSSLSSSWASRYYIGAGRVS